MTPKSPSLSSASSSSSSVVSMTVAGATTTTVGGPNAVDNILKNRQLLLLSMFAFAAAIRIAVSLHPYSGENTPPMYGDYEAQRHWMEITLNLPAAEWYMNTTRNDLNYWGLDYPPLSAYASAILGLYVRHKDAKAVELFTSRGYESVNSRYALRWTVLFCDLVFFFPMMACVVRWIYPGMETHKRDSLLFMLSMPSFILVDHAHFQYNNVGAALFLASVFVFLPGARDEVGAALFCACIWFKQTALCYGLPVAALLAARAGRRVYAPGGSGRGSEMRRRIGKYGIYGAAIYTLRVTAAVVCVTVATFAPWMRWRAGEFLLGGVIARLFPVARGLYEDKVSNVWCTASLVLRPKPSELLSPGELVKACAVLTLLACAPFCAAILARPTATRLLLGTGGCALGAFLFAYQVHEKQILLAVLPVAPLHARFPRISAWLSISAVISLFPLLHREGSTLAYFGVLAIHLVLIDASGTCYKAATNHARITSFAVSSFMCTAVLLHVLFIFATPPAHLPHLFTVAITSFSCLQFCLLYAALLYHCLYS